MCGSPVVEIPSHYIAHWRGNVDSKVGACYHHHVS